MEKAERQIERDEDVDNNEPGALSPEDERLSEAMARQPWGRDVEEVEDRRPKMTIAQAMAVLQRSHAAIYRRIDAGDLVRVRVRGRAFVTVWSVRRLMERLYGKGGL